MELDRRSLLAASALTAFLWLCLGGTASAAAPANDNLADAATLSGLAPSASGTNVDATKEAGEPNHAGVAGGHSVWWKWTAPQTGGFSFSVCGGTFIPSWDSVLAVYTGSSVGALHEVASNDDGCGEGSVVRFRANAGQTYYIAVDGAGGALGDPFFVLNATPGPNDDFELSLPLSGLGGLVSAFTHDTPTKEPGEPNHAGNASGHSLWWHWTAPVDGSARVETCASHVFSAPPFGRLDTVLAIYTGTAVGALSHVASNDDAPEGYDRMDLVPRPCRPGSAVAFSARAGRTYRIAVDVATGVEPFGTFEIWLQETPAPGREPPGNGAPAASGPRAGACANATSGTAGPDGLTGSAFGDALRGLAGNDTLLGLAGDDCLSGDSGNDRLSGHAGKDRLSGNTGKDRLWGRSGNDRLSGGRHQDRLSGDSGDDRLSGDSGNDLLQGGSGRDRLSGGSGNDRIRARDGRRERVNCGSGRDRVSADRRDRLRGCELIRRN